jgi:hypothetical protein
VITELVYGADVLVVVVLAGAHPAHAVSVLEAPHDTAQQFDNLGHWTILDGMRGRFLTWFAGENSSASAS